MAKVSTGQITLYDSNDAIVAVLSNEAHTVPAAVDGSSPVLTGAASTLSILLAGVAITSLYSVTATPSSGLTGSLSTYTYTVSGMTVDVGYVDFTATRAGFATIVKRFSLAKAKAGTTGPQGSASPAYRGTGILTNVSTASFTYHTVNVDGSTTAGGNVSPNIGDWMLNISSSLTKTFYIWSGSTWSTSGVTSNHRAPAVEDMLRLIKGGMVIQDGTNYFLSLLANEGFFDVLATRRMRSLATVDSGAAINAGSPIWDTNLNLGEQKVLRKNDGKVLMSFNPETGLFLGNDIQVDSANSILSSYYRVSGTSSNPLRSGPSTTSVSSSSKFQNVCRLSGESCIIVHEPSSTSTPYDPLRFATIDNAGGITLGARFSLPIGQVSGLVAEIVTVIGYSASSFVAIYVTGSPTKNLWAVKGSISGTAVTWGTPAKVGHVVDGASGFSSPQACWANNAKSIIAVTYGYSASPYPYMVASFTYNEGAGTFGTAYSAVIENSNSSGGFIVNSPIRVVDNGILVSYSYTGTSLKYVQITGITGTQSPSVWTIGSHGSGNSPQSIVGYDFDGSSNPTRVRMYYRNSSGYLCYVYASSSSGTLTWTWSETSTNAICYLNNGSGSCLNKSDNSGFMVFFSTWSSGSGYTNYRMVESWGSTKITEKVGVGITETASNGNGNYIAFADGSLICYGRINTAIVSSYGPSGGLVLGPYNFPTTFSGEPSIAVSSSENGGLGGARYETYSPSSGGTQWAAIISNNWSTTLALRIEWIAVGRWKA